MAIWTETGPSLPTYFSLIILRREIYLVRRRRRKWHTRLWSADFFSARKLELPKLSPEAEVGKDEHMAFRELRLRRGAYSTLLKTRREIMQTTQGQVRTQRKREKSGPNFFGSSVLAGRGEPASVSGQTRKRNAE